MYRGAATRVLPHGLVGRCPPISYEASGSLRAIGYHSRCCTRYFASHVCDCPAVLAAFAGDLVVVAQEVISHVASLDPGVVWETAHSVPSAPLSARMSIPGCEAAPVDALGTLSKSVSDGVEGIDPFGVPNRVKQCIPPSVSLIRQHLVALQMPLLSACAMSARRYMSGAPGKECGEQHVDGWSEPFSRGQGSGSLWGSALGRLFRLSWCMRRTTAMAALVRWPCEPVIPAYPARTRARIRARGWEVAVQHGADRRGSESAENPFLWGDISLRKRVLGMPGRFRLRAAARLHAKESAPSAPIRPRAVP